MQYAIPFNYLPLNLAPMGPRGEYPRYLGPPLAGQEGGKTVLPQFDNAHEDHHSSGEDLNYTVEQDHRGV